MKRRSYRFHSMKAFLPLYEALVRSHRIKHIDAIGLSRFVQKRSAGANAKIMSPAHRHAKLKAYVLHREMCLLN